MTFVLYAHPFSSYCQKAIVAFYEKGITFELRMLDGSEPVASEFSALWPVGRFPILRHEDRTIFEATSIIEYIEALRPEPGRLVPSDPVVAAEARMWDRFFDNYVSYPQQRLVYASLGRESSDDTDRWRTALETAYGFLDSRIAKREWAAGDSFSLADCAAAPALLYADWSHRIPEGHPNLWAYRQRLLERPSYARTLAEARPYRDLFPLDAPTDRD